MGVLVALVVALQIVAGSALAASRIKDITDFEGIRENMLVGYGIVVGLNGTGDKLSKSPFTQQSLIAMLERLGVNTRDSITKLDTKNVAAVMVTATLKPFARQGTRFDITVNSLGDSKSLRGGTLLVTPLLGADGEVYAVAQGPVAIAGFTASGDAQTVTQGIATTGRIANGAIVEREIGFELAKLKSVKISLRNPDLTTARRIAEAINSALRKRAARPLDPATVLLTVPRKYRNNIVGLLTDIEQLQVRPDTIAKVIIDETSGIIVMGERVRISTVAIAQGNLTIRITETPQVSQPGPFTTGGTTTTVPRTRIDVEEQGKKKFGIVKNSLTLQQLVTNLNALGIGPRDLIGILQAIKAAGAMQASLEVR
ncbi:MAG: flagellar basal body P-ring protein FlgI [Alphaproteobacteria bacterium]|nr:flagellar basal body P-ring protein FlgI [Alphaproteobacteria bacterium]